MSVRERVLQPGAWRGLRQALAYVGLSLLSVVGGLVVWHVLSLFWSETLLPGPLEVIESLAVVWRGGVLRNAVLATLYHILVSAGIVIVLGSVLGFAMGLWAGAEEALSPWVPLFQVLPGIVAMAFALVAFGVGSTSVIFSMVVVGISYMVLNVWHGFKSIDADLLELVVLGNAWHRSALLRAPVVVPVRGYVGGAAEQGGGGAAERADAAGRRAPRHFR